MTYDVGKPPDQLFVFVSFSGRLSLILQMAVKKANARIETTTPPHMPKQDQRVILTQNLKFGVLQDPLPKVSEHCAALCIGSSLSQSTMECCIVPIVLIVTCLGFPDGLGQNLTLFLGME